MGNDFRKVRDRGKLREQGAEQRQTIVPDLFVRRVYENFVEEQVDFGAQARDDAFDGLPLDALIFLIQFFLRARLKQRFVYSAQAGRPVPLRLLQNVFDPLEAGGQGLEIGGLAQVLDADETRLEVYQIGPAGGHGGVHFVVGEAAHVAEVVADAVGDELAQRVVVQVRGELELELAFHDDLDHAL